jgi:DNA replication and repair protein RecF
VIPLRIESIAVRGVRNLERMDLSPGHRFNVVSGDNGQGKTSLLEAIYLVMTTRSFRTTRLRDVVTHGRAVASVRARVVEGDQEREQSVGIEGATRHVVLSGKRPPSLSAYAVGSPVVVFHPGEIVLSSGPAERRRQLLDRVALFVDPASLDHAARYAKAVRSRQRTLETRGSGAVELEAFERLMAEHGSALMRVRARATEALVGELCQAFERITSGVRTITARFCPGGPMVASELLRTLRDGRERDRMRGNACAGPHRDDLSISLAGFDARTEASQGEHRAITMALKLAELSCIAAARGVYPVLLLDDVSSELDVSRTALLFGLLGDTPGQVFLTTTRPSLIEIPAQGPDQRVDYRVEGGVLKDV